MQIKVVSDGHGNGSKVVNAETGEEIEGVFAVDIRVEAGQPTAAKVHFNDVAVHVEAEVER